MRGKYFLIQDSRDKRYVFSQLSAVALLQSIATAISCNGRMQLRETEQDAPRRKVAVATQKGMTKKNMKEIHYAVVYPHVNGLF